LLKVLDMKSATKPTLLTEMTDAELASVCGGYEESEEPPQPTDLKSYRIWWNWYITYGGGTKDYASSI